MKQRNHFRRITSLQVHLAYRSMNILTARSFGVAIATKMPALERFIVDLALHKLFCHVSCRPKPWLAEMLWPIRVKQLRLINTVAPSTLHPQSHTNMVAEAYSKVLTRHCETIPTSTPPGGNNAKSELTDGSEGRLMADRNDCTVLHSAVCDGILGELAGDSAKVVVLRSRLELGKDQYFVALREQTGTRTAGE